MADIEGKTLPKELVSGVEFVDYDSSLSDARRALKSAPALIVTKDGEYSGVVDFQDPYGKEVAQALRIGEDREAGGQGPAGF